MKTNLDKAAVLFLAAALVSVPGNLLAQGKGRSYLGITGGFSWFDAYSVDPQSFPGIYPGKPVFGLFFTGTDYTRGEDSPWAVNGKIELFYLAQTAFYDAPVMDELGNIVDTYEVKCVRTFLQIDSVGKIALTSKSRVIPVLLAGLALAIPLKTSREPATEDPAPENYKRAILSLVFGVGLEAELGKLYLSLDVRYDFGFDSLSWSRMDPKPDALMIVAGLGF